MQRTALLLFCSLALAWPHQGAEALYSASSKVKLVDPQRFSKTVLGSQIPSVVEFFAPWCACMHPTCILHDHLIRYQRMLWKLNKYRP